MSKNERTEPPPLGQSTLFHSRNPKYFQGLSPERDQFPDEVEECKKKEKKREAGRRWKQIAGVAQLTRALPA